MRRRKKSLGTLRLVGILGSGLVLALALWGATRKHGSRGGAPFRDTLARTGTEWIDILPNHELAPRPGARKRDALVTRQGDTVFDVTYSIDQYRRRVTPARNTRPKKRHAIFLGCALTFGLDSNDNETIPYYFAEEARDFRAYNLGFIGYGPNDIVARMTEREDFWAGIREKEGDAYYLFIPDHAARLTGTMSWLRRAKDRHPFFHETGEGAVAQEGTFRSARPYRTGILRFLSEAGLPALLDGLSVIPWENAGRSLWIRMLEEMRSQYLSRFPRGKFHLVLLPEHGHFSLPEPFSKRLEESGISYLDLTRQTFGGRIPNLHPFDSHYPPAANRIIADRLRQAVQGQAPAQRAFLDSPPVDR